MEILLEQTTLNIIYTSKKLSVGITQGTRLVLFTSEGDVKRLVYALTVPDL